MNRNEKLIASRDIPKSAIKVASKKSSAVAYLYQYQANGAVLAKGYVGNAAKPAFNYRFKDAARRAQYVADWLKQCDESEARKAAQLAERKNKLAGGHDLKVGDVLSGSWGYDQTNVEFWQVTKLIGRRMVEIRELACMSEETGFMSGVAVPVPGEFTSKAPLRRMVNEGGSVKLFDFGCCLRKYEPIEVAGCKVFRPASWTAYA